MDRLRNNPFFYQIVRQSEFLDRQLRDKTARKVKQVQSVIDWRAAGLSDQTPPPDWPDFLAQLPPHRLQQRSAFLWFSIVSGGVYGMLVALVIPAISLFTAPSLSPEQLLIITAFSLISGLAGGGVYGGLTGLFRDPYLRISYRAIRAYEAFLSLYQAKNSQNVQ
jgi:hypothetical protein